jgi:hypothetical protein
MSSDEEKLATKWKRLEYEKVSRFLEFVEPTVHWCGTDNCQHRGSEHGVNNKCLVCDCKTFSSRTYGEDMATILRFVNS